MKLKGKIVKNLKPKQKEKMEKTLKRMKKTREKDYKLLRDILEKKLVWAIAEKEKGEKAIVNYENAIKKLKEQTLRLEGIVLLAKDILQDKKDNKKS